MRLRLITGRLRWTREGLGYLVLWLGLLAIGIYLQINLVLLVAGLVAGPIAVSLVGSAAMLRKLKVTRRVPAYVFAGEPLVVQYTLENLRRWDVALAVEARDRFMALERPGAGDAEPRLFFARVPGGERQRIRWEGPGMARGRYRCDAIELISRAPFGLLERGVTLSQPGNLLVYPAVGRLTRRWRLVQREASEARRGRRYHRTARQQEYHGLRDYRSGDSPRWIHWRTSARVGELMVKEFEQQAEQDLAVLIDPWLPRAGATDHQQQATEDAIRFAATVCLEACRQATRRLLLGWTGPAPGVRHGPAAPKLLHELLEQLAVLRPSAEGTLAALFDALPPATLREAMVVIVATRPVNLQDETARSARLAGWIGQGLTGRVLLLDAMRGDLADLIEFGTPEK